MLGLRPLEYLDYEGLHSRNRRVRNNHSERTNGKGDATLQRTERSLPGKEAFEAASPPTYSHTVKKVYEDRRTYRQRHLNIFL